jgi:outer membrane protein TolC
MKSLLLTMILVSGAYARQGDVLTLDSAIAIGRDNSRSLQIAAARADGARARAGEASSALLPGLRLNGSYARLSDGDFKLSTPGAPAGVSVAPVVVDNYAFRLQLQQPIFTGFKLNNLADAAHNLAEAGERDLQMSDADLVFTITSAYWSLHQAITTETFVGDNVRRLEAYRSDTERLLQSGLATRNDLLKIEVQLANARIASIDAENDVMLARMNLNNVLGRPLDTPAVPGSLPTDLQQADSILVLAEGGEDGRLTSYAWTSRPDLIAAGYQVEAAKANASATRGSYWPQLDLTAGYNYNRPNARYQPITPEFLGSWDIGVNLQFDIWNWGRTGHQSEAAEAAVRQSELAASQLRDNVALDVRRAALTLRRSREKLAVATLGVEQARENRRMTDDRYKNGLATSSELLDAEVALVQAETSLAGSEVEFAVARARLVRSLGASTPHVAGR